MTVTIQPHLPPDALDKIGNEWRSGDCAQLRAAYDALELINEALPYYSRAYGSPVVGRAAIVGEIARACGAARSSINQRLLVADAFPKSMTDQIPLTFTQWYALRVPDGEGGVDWENTNRLIEWATVEYFDAHGGTMPSVDAIRDQRRIMLGGDTSADRYERLRNSGSSWAERVMLSDLDGEHYLRRAAALVLDIIAHNEAISEDE